ncbi:MAG: TIGR00269 family protein [Thaumarchaeota archaeon]|nr:TIGR00269 family protein [Nitrososphaerota archaeon]
MSSVVCVRCGGKAFYTRRYSGEVLCGPCFQASIVEKTRKTISRYGMLRHGEKVGVAVSGGKDSLSLLHVLHALNGTRRYQLVVLTVDEGVEGYREESMEHSAALTRELGLEHVIVSYKELYGFDLDHALAWKDEREVSSCSMCGVFRRRAIDEAAVRAGVSVIATAHNLDDYVQTFMMNLMHGDVERLGWIDPRVVDTDFPLHRVKPFMEIYEEEVALYAHLSGLPFQSASCPYMHEGLRSEVRDYLNELEAKHPGMKNVLLSSALQVSSRISASKGPSPVPCTLCGQPSSGGLCNVCRMKQLVEQHTKYTPD